MIDRWHRLRNGDVARDGGMTLIEILVAMTMITIGVLGLLAELASDIKQQSTERTQTNAIHLATSDLEQAKNNSFSTLLSLLGTSTDYKTVQGVNYTRITTLQLCGATDRPTVCNTPALGAAATARASVAVSWVVNGTTHTVNMARNIADNSSTTVTNTVNPLGSCGGGGTTLVAGHLTLSPSSVNVNAAGNPTQNVTATLTQSGLSNASCVPLTWSDDTGSHQLSMANSSGTYSVQIPSSSITKSSSTNGGTVTFNATVPGTQAVPSATLSIIGRPSFGTCSVNVATLGLNTLTELARKTLLPATITCTTTNLTKNDTVQATFQSGAVGNNKTVNLSSSDGNTWSANLNSGTQLSNSGGTEQFSFSLTRGSDSATASTAITVTVL